MPTFNPTIRDYIFVEFKLTRNRKNHIWVSLLPFLVSIVICTLLPEIIIIWNFLGTTIYNFNGYIIPMMLKMNYLKQEKKPYWKYVLGITFCLLSMFFYIGYLVYDKVTGSKK
jgi:hypothetical protein